MNIKLVGGKLDACAEAPAANQFPAEALRSSSESAGSSLSSLAAQVPTCVVVR